MDETASQIELDKDDNKKYVVDVICNSKVYAKKSDSNHPLGLYYLVSWKSYLDKENHWEPVLAMQYL